MAFRTAALGALATCRASSAASAKETTPAAQKIGKGPGLLREIDGNWAIRVTFLRESVNFLEH